MHQRWQVDFKLGLPLTDGSQVNLTTVRDPVGEVCIAAQVSPAARSARPYLLTAPTDRRSAPASCRTLSPASDSRISSLTRRMEILSVGIGPSGEKIASVGPDPSHLQPSTPPRARP